MEPLTKQEAKDFFSEFYYGDHHIPGRDIYEFGSGWMVKHDLGDFATYDYNGLTRLVLMAHYYCYRVSISNHGPKCMKLCVWRRQPEGSMSQRHPTIEKAIEDFMKTKTVPQTI